MTALPTTIGYSIVCVPNRSTPNLSMADDKKVLESVLGNGHTIFTETVGKDDDQVKDVFPESVYRRVALGSENNIVVRKARFPQCHKFDPPTSLKNFKARSGAHPGEHVDKTVTPFVHSDGSLRRYGYFYMGTSKSHVQPLRSGSFDMWGFEENPEFDPGCDIGIHLVSAVRKSIGSTYEYRVAERKEQWHHVTVPAINALTDAGINVQLFGDPNWLNPDASGIKGKITRFVNTKYSIIWFIQAPKANWGLHLVTPGIKHVDNPSDHNAEIAHVEARANKLYVPSDGPVLPTTVEQKFMAIIKKYQIDSNAEAELRAALSEV